MGQQNRPALGKGLASLFPAAASVAPSGGAGAMAAGRPTTPEQLQAQLTAAQLAGNHDRVPGVSLVSTTEIQVSPYQPRRDFDETALEELAQSIRSNGIIQPLVVRRVSNGYELIAGERRLRASKLAGLKQVPIIIRRSTDREALELALIENIQRQDLNCVDEALAYFQLVQEFSLTQEEVANRVGKDRATVANFLRLLRLPQEILEDLKAGKLSHGHGKALLSLDDNVLRMRVRDRVLAGHLSVRETEAIIESLKNQPVESLKREPAVPKPPETRLATVAQEMTRKFATRVEIKGSERRGKIVLHFSSREELDRLLEAMSK